MRAGQSKLYEITLKNAATPGLPAPASSKPDAGTEQPAAPTDESNDGPSVQAIAESNTLNEDLQILADYTELLRGAKRVPPPASLAR